MERDPIVLFSCIIGGFGARARERLKTWASMPPARPLIFSPEIPLSPPRIRCTVYRWRWRSQQGGAGDHLRVPDQARLPERGQVGLVSVSIVGARYATVGFPTLRPQVVVVELGATGLLLPLSEGREYYMRT